MGTSFILRSGPNEEVHPCDASHVGSQVKNTLPDLAVFVGKESDSYPKPTSSYPSFFSRAAWETAPRRRKLAVDRLKSAPGSLVRGDLPPPQTH